jgi:Fe(II)/alpha-ketoglutarate-dependent arginine beta-hydroxylase
MVDTNVAALEKDEARFLQDFSLTLSERYSSSEDEKLLDDSAVLAHEIPLRIKQAVNRFRLEDSESWLVLRGHLVDQQRIGLTPVDWRNRPLRGAACPEEILLILYSALLGDPFGWRTQQDGRLIHEVFPIQKDKHAQLGTGSSEVLTWHTEDAFHPFRADYLLLFAMRNHDRVPTTVGRLDLKSIHSDLIQVLFEERFIIRPDESHLPHNNTAAESGNAAFDQISSMQSNPNLVAILEGDRASPYVRLDPYFMDTPHGDHEARAALKAIISAIDANMSEVALQSGDLLFLDNRRAVHGRPAFRAKFDGSDRWLKRINVTRDLRKSRYARDSSKCRLIG